MTKYNSSILRTNNVIILSINRVLLISTLIYVSYMEGVSGLVVKPALSDAPEANIVGNPVHYLLRPPPPVKPPSGDVN